MALALEKCFSFVLLIIIATLAHVATSRTFSEVTMAARHEHWMARHGRAYASKEEKEARFKIFVNNAKFIKNFNQAANATYKLGINQFADLTHEEFVASHAFGFEISLSSHPESLHTESFLYENVSLTEVEPSLDWRAKGAVTPVKDQDPCGSCWIFSGVAAIEGITKIKTGKLISLSEQEVMDCIAPGRDMCYNGGYPSQVFEFVASGEGLVSESVYPYRAADEYCNPPRNSPTATISTYQSVPRGNEGALLKAVSRQPISVGIDARSLQFYRNGIVNGYCSSTYLNHAVTIVGYGATERGDKYWVVKNSWGKSWGDDGYFYVERDSGMQGGMCGIAMKASYPIINN